MELLRTLGALAEPPCDRTKSWAELLGFEATTLPTLTEHGELFDFELYPFASVYLGEEGMLGGESRDRIAGFWRALDQQPPNECDHLVVLLATAAELARMENEASEGTALRMNHARKVFVWEHLLSWLPVWLGRVEALGSPFYRRWAELLNEALFDQAAQLGPAESLPLALRAAPELADPRVDGGKVFLDQLLAPVRTGMILTRSDLVRAARELGIGARIGERRYVLEALFSQAPEALLRWLAGEAKHSAEQHQRRTPHLGEVADFWQVRAERSARIFNQLADEARDRSAETSESENSSTAYPTQHDRPASGTAAAQPFFGESHP